jgi:hypothetical protein
LTSTDAATAGTTCPAALAPAAAGATPAALLGAGAAAALVAAGAAAAALLAAAGLDDVALLEDFLLAHPATNSAAIPRKTVALIAGDVARIAFFILGLLQVDLLVIT